MDMPFTHCYLTVDIFLLDLKILHQMFTDLLLHNRVPVLRVLRIHLLGFEIGPIVGVDGRQNGEYYVLPFFLQLEVFVYHLLLLGPGLGFLNARGQIL